MPAGGLSVHTTLLLDGDCAVAVHRQARDDGCRYAVVEVGRDGYHTVHLRDVTVIDRLSAALADARAWLAAQSDATTSNKNAA